MKEKGDKRRGKRGWGDDREITKKGDLEELEPLIHIAEVLPTQL